MDEAKADRSLAGGAPAGIEVREVQTYDELRLCTALTRRTWGDEDGVPATLLQALRKVEGLVAGAFADDGSLLGTLIGITGRRDGEVVHWSHMLAVAADWRDRGIGGALKRYQGRRMVEAGIQRILWSYDPLESRNAYLNLCRLGARIVELVRDLYGPGVSRLHRGIGTDRFVVEWRPAEDGPRSARSVEGTPSVGLGGEAEALPSADVVEIEIPDDIQAVKASSPETAAAWRRVTRRAFEHYLAEGYAIGGFRRDRGHGVYVVRREGK